MKKQLEKVLKQYIKEFENKQYLTFEFAVDDNLMEVLYLKNATATIYSFTAEPRIITF